MERSTGAVFFGYGLMLGALGVRAVLGGGGAESCDRCCARTGCWWRPRSGFAAATTVLALCAHCSGRAGGAGGRRDGVAGDAGHEGTLVDAAEPAGVGAGPRPVGGHQLVFMGGRAIGSLVWVCWPARRAVSPRCWSAAGLLAFCALSVVVAAASAPATWT